MCNPVGPIFHVVATNHLESMPMKFALSLLLGISLSSPSFANPSLGVTTIEVAGNEAGRPLQLTIWYSGIGGTVESIGGNAVFSGESAVRDASVADQKFPLVLISHGGLRSARDSGAWLSVALARSGYIVVEVNGPRPNSAAEAVNEIWKRPDDLARALDTVFNDPDWSQHVDKKRISIVGFALGGTAALMVAGGTLDTQSFTQSCDTVDVSPDCSWYGAQSVSLDSVDVLELKKPRRDPRIGSIVAIAPEFIQAISEGLSTIDAPIQLIVLGNENGLSGDISANAAVHLLPNVKISDGFQICTPAGPKILAEDGGDPSLCGPSVEARLGAHLSISESIIPFLAEQASN